MDFKEQVNLYLSELAMKDYDKPEEIDPEKMAETYVNNAYSRIQKYMATDPKYTELSADEKVAKILNRIKQGLGKTSSGLFNIKVDGVLTADKLMKMPQATKNSFFRYVEKYIEEELKKSPHLKDKNQKKTLEKNKKYNNMVSRGLRDLGKNEE